MFDVVMPLYNKREFVGAAIDSVLAQTFPDWRLFIVDDGSTDGGPELAASCDDPRISLIQQSNQGVGPARNTGIRAGDADWICFLDADDLWDPEHLEELDALRAGFPQAVLIGCRFQRFCGSTPPAAAQVGPAGRRLARYFRECACERELFQTSSAAVQRQALTAVGDFKPLPGNEDVELWARLALHGPIAVSHRKTVNYRVATGGITDAGMGGSNPEAKPRERKDFSSTIPTLEQALPGITDPVLRADINAYMDSRIGIRMVAAVLEGDLVYARYLRTLYRDKPTGKARQAALLARLPRPLARLVLTAGLSTKRLLRRGRT